MTMTMTLVVIIEIVVTLTICKILVLVMVMMRMNVLYQCRLSFGKCLLCKASYRGWVGVVLAKYNKWLGRAIQLLARTLFHRGGAIELAISLTH